MVRTEIRSLEKVDGAEENPAAMAVVIAVSVAETTRLQNMHLKLKMKQGPVYKLAITKTGHRLTQFKKITDALPVLCADTNFQGLNEVLWTGRDLVKTDFMLTYPHTTQWSTTHHVQISIVNPMDVPAADGSLLAHFEIMEQPHIFDANLQKKLLLEYKRDLKNKS